MVSEELRRPGRATSWPPDPDLGGQHCLEDLARRPERGRVIEADIGKRSSDTHTRGHSPVPVSRPKVHASRPQLPSPD